ncbi:MAG TPA: hypothetical protein VMT63_11120 [Bacteroidales bacterium]|nr:hypothetical protein [Bacteroidales bacterium]
MKKAIFTLAVTVMVTISLSAQNIPEADIQLIDKFIQSRISIKKENLTNDTVKKVITGSVYLVKTLYADSSSSAVLTDNRVVIKDGKLIELEDLSTNKKLARLFSLVRKDFTIRTEADAIVFERVLDKLYPLSWSTEKYRQHLLKDGKWYFVRGEFFENKEAVIVTLDAGKRIINISFALEALKK